MTNYVRYSTRPERVAHAIIADAKRGSADLASVVELHAGSRTWPRAIALAAGERCLGPAYAGNLCGRTLCEDLCGPYCGIYAPKSLQPKVLCGGPMQDLCRIYATNLLAAQ